MPNNMQIIQDFKLQASLGALSLKKISKGQIGAPKVSGIPQTLFDKKSLSNLWLPYNNELK